MRGKATDRRAEMYSQHGLAPSHGRVAITHWSQACFDVVARVEDCWPLRRLGAVVVGGLSPAWHLFTCLESRSLPSQRSKARVSQKAKTIEAFEVKRTFARTGLHSADICKGGPRCLRQGDISILNMKTTASDGKRRRRGWQEH